ncbi:MAG TPA: hypothetical protein VNH64_03645 [Parvularculaceae bacterium]|nr:hypothetical protein [Parvularculaceae bacterium]
MPTFSHFDGENAIDGEFSMKLLRHFSLSVGSTYVREKEGGNISDGFHNIETTAKWQFITSAKHELLLSTGVGVEWGGSGSTLIGAEETTTIAPALYFGKGFGDLPDSMKWARPFAVTGVASYALPAHRFTADGERNANEFNFGGSIQYSLPYFNSQVRALGWPNWAVRFIPLVEFNYARRSHNFGAEPATSFVNPGIIWVGRYVQLGAEARVPLNRASGHGVGFALQLHFFLDDIFPHTIGAPLLGDRL